VFRSGVNLVRVDVSVADGRGTPLDDLQPSDFEVFEDGIPQRIETLQFLRLDGQSPPGSTRSLGIRSRQHAEAEAAREDVRVFAIFLDDYHLDRHPSITMSFREALTHFVGRLGPTDLVAVMEPLTLLDELEFTRSRDELLARIKTFEGRRGEVFPLKSALEEAQLTQGNIGELRMQVTLTAMAALARYLGTLREGRTSILFVTQGPPVSFYRGDQTYLDDVVEAANRGNVTINVLDPRGLGSAPLGGTFAQSRLTAETGGRLIGNVNDHSRGLDQVVEDASAYYLLGYSPARVFADGQFHEIEVKVNRSGARVLARRGYWAPAEEEMARAAEPTPAAVPNLQRSLAAVAAAETDRPVHIWIGFSRGDPGQTRLEVTWDRGVESSAASPMAERLDVELLDRESGKATQPPQTIGRVRTPDGGAVVAVFGLAPGPVTLRFTARAADDAVADRWAELVDVPAFDAAPPLLATLRVLRAQSPLEFRLLGTNPDPVPEASRHFGRTDRVLVEITSYADGDAHADVAAALLNSQGESLVELPVPPFDAGHARLEIPIASLAPGTYMIRVQARLGDDVAEQLDAFTVTR
jgi:VWFA-related protein